MWGELLVSVWSKLTTVKTGHFDFQNRPLVATPTVAADAAKEASEAASYDDGRVIVIAG
jgi:hypothetical protein